MAEISLGPTRDIQVHRVTCVVDCGLAINPDGVAQPMESAIAYGLSAALRGEITITHGAINQRNYDTYKAMRLHESPVVETHIVRSTDAPAGIGDTGLPPIAPAVANALFSLTGVRLRQLPLRIGVAVETS
jgi:isoquinoline 1-oxidoreductase beta subunit